MRSPARTRRSTPARTRSRSCAATRSPSRCRCGATESKWDFRPVTGARSWTGSRPGSACSSEHRTSSVARGAAASDTRRVDPLSPRAGRRSDIAACGRRRGARDRGSSAAPGPDRDDGHLWLMRALLGRPVRQWSVGLGFTYLVPSSGVLTKFQVRVGTPVDATDWVQARTFRTSGPPGATVISEGTQHSLAGLSAGTRTFFDRVPATAGDVLGGRFHILSRPDATPAQFGTTSTADVAGISFSLPPNDAEVGDLFSAETPVPAQQRVNMHAVLESDADADGYGDTSQDLCPATAAATTACSGSLFGSRLQ